MISFQHFHHVKFQLHKQKQIFRHQQNFFSVESEEYAIQERHVTVCDERNTFNNVLEVFFMLLANRKYWIAAQITPGILESSSCKKHSTLA